MTIIRHNTDNIPTVAVLPDGTTHIFGEVTYVTGEDAEEFMQMQQSEDRWFVVVGISDDGAEHAYSRRQWGSDGPFTGEWGLLTHHEATELAAAVNAHPNPPGEHIEAHVVEVYRFEGDPIWTEADPIWTEGLDGH